MEESQGRVDIDIRSVDDALSHREKRATCWGVEEDSHIFGDEQGWQAALCIAKGVV